jgi:hypothetical protein
VSTPEVETPQAETPRRRRAAAGKYAILKEISEGAELLEILEKGEHRVFVLMDKDVQAKSGEAAIRGYAIRDDDVLTGKYVAPPMTSFRPALVKSVPQLFADE